MTTPAPPPAEPVDPHDAPGLSPRERAELARIEARLVEDDPVLARELVTRRAPLLGVRAPVSVRQSGLLVVIMVVLAGATRLPESLWWPVLPLLTVGLVAPWIAYCVRHRAAD